MSKKDLIISKFLSALKVDSIFDVQYIGKEFRGNCVCGQSLEHGYKFFNKRNGKECVVGRTCLKYITEYLNWK